MIAVFIGPDDSATCDGCSEAVNGNPYDVLDVPTPGEFECMSRCRHMVQIQGEDVPEDMAFMSWTSDFGFVDDAELGDMMVTMSDIPDAVDLATIGDALATVNVDDPVALAGLVMDAGIDLNVLAAEADLSAEEVAAIQAEIDGGVASATVDNIIVGGDVDLLIAKLADEDALAEAIDIGQSGLDNPEDAYTLRDALNAADSSTYVVEVQDDELWHVITEDQATVIDDQLQP